MVFQVTGVFHFIVKLFFFIVHKIKALNYFDSLTRKTKADIFTMRTKLNSKQRQRMRNKREHNAEIEEASENDEELSECQVCYTQLTSKNKVDLLCEHNIYF